MTDKNKIELIRAYKELLEVVANKGDDLRAVLKYENGSHVGYKKVQDVIDHLSEEIQKLTFAKENPK